MLSDSRHSSETKPTRRRASTAVRALAISALTLFSSTGAAAADEVRHCAGQIQITTTSGVDADGEPFLTQANTRRVSLLLQGRGTCPSSAYGNDCRRHARDAVIKCARRLWETRWNPSEAADLCGDWHDGRPPHAGVQIWGDGADADAAPKLNGSIKASLENTACCLAHPTAREVNFRIFLNVYGGERCQREEPLYDGIYAASCQQLRRDGICGPPRRTN